MARKEILLTQLLILCSRCWCLAGFLLRLWNEALQMLELTTFLSLTLYNKSSAIWSNIVSDANVYSQMYVRTCGLLFEYNLRYRWHCTIMRTRGKVITNHKWNLYKLCCFIFVHLYWSIRIRNNNYHCQYILFLPMGKEAVCTRMARHYVYTVANILANALY